MQTVAVIGLGYVGLPLVVEFGKHSRTIGFDIVEVAPALDATYRSAMNGNTLLYTCLTGIAMRKKGITKPNYFNPLTVDHGQDNYHGDRK